MTVYLNKQNTKFYRIFNNEDLNTELQNERLWFKAGDTRPVYLNQGDYLVQVDHDDHWKVVSRDDFVIDYQEIK